MRHEDCVQEKIIAAILEASHDLILVCNREGRILSINPECENISGYKNDEVKGTFIWNFALDPEYAMRTKELYSRALDDGDVFNIHEGHEHYWISKSGERRRISWTTRLIYNENNTLVYIIRIGKDMTQQRIMKKRLRQSEAELHSIFENANGIIYTLSSEGRFIFVSRGWTETLGHDVSEVQGQLFERFVHPDSVPVCYDYLKEILTNGETKKSAEYQVRHRNGRWRWHSSTGAAVKDDDGKPIYYVGLALDITERKKAEEEIKYLSFYDKLTGLYNRAFFEEELKRLDTPRALPLSLIMGDVNGLKLINDALGHWEGDKLLIKVAEILKKSCRHEDCIARWGGDEFITLLPGLDGVKASKVFERIKSASKSIEGFPIQTSISLGMGTKSCAAQDIREVIKEAEDKMYRNKLLESRSIRSSFLFSLEKTLWTRSHETKEHCQRLQKIAYKIGRALNLPDSELDNLKLLAALHDIGKIAIPNSILENPGKLSPEEWETMKKHPEIGYRIAISSPEMAPIAEAILHHHERWDGTGYPLGLIGENIPLISRIIAIADTYDVMVNGRPYQKAVSKESAWGEIMRCAGSQFDPQLVKKSLEVLRGLRT